MPFCFVLFVYFGVLYDNPIFSSLGSLWCCENFQFFCWFQTMPEDKCSPCSPTSKKKEQSLGFSLIHKIKEQSLWFCLVNVNLQFHTISLLRLSFALGMSLWEIYENPVFLRKSGMSPTSQFFPVNITGFSFSLISHEDHITSVVLILFLVTQCVASSLLHNLFWFLCTELVVFGIYYSCAVSQVFLKVLQCCFLVAR